MHMHYFQKYHSKENDDPSNTMLIQSCLYNYNGDKGYYMDKTLKYYDENAEKFVQGTATVDFSETQNRFLSKLNQGASILDFGCGSGRDTKFFLDKGYIVSAIDGSKELCELASEYTGINVHRMLFQELSDISQYDGIWACSYILHVPKNQLKNVIERMVTALKDDGVIYSKRKTSLILKSLTMRALKRPLN